MEQKQRIIYTSSHASKASAAALKAYQKLEDGAPVEQSTPALIVLTLVQSALGASFLSPSYSAAIVQQDLISDRIKRSRMLADQPETHARRQALQIL